MFFYLCRVISVPRDHVAPAHTHTHTHTHKYTLLQGKTGATQVPSARILVSLIVKQDKACPTPIGPSGSTEGRAGTCCSCSHTHTHTHTHTMRTRQHPTNARGVLKRGGGGSVPERQFGKKTACSSHVQPWLVAIGGWQLVEIGGWRLATGGWSRLVVVGGGRWLVIGGWWRLVAVGGWRLVAAGGWRRVAVGGWRFAAVGWRLVVPWGGP